jgi:uncharacterized protein (DUF2384 family)
MEVADRVPIRALDIMWLVVQTVPEDRHQSIAGVPRTTANRRRDALI